MSESRDKTTAGSSNMDMKTRGVEGEVELDPQDIAALLEGRLDSRRRAELIERLAASPSNAALLSDAMWLRAELDVPAAGSQRPPMAFRSIRWLALAASIAGVGILGWVLVSRQSSASVPAARYAVQLAKRSSISALPSNWDNQRGPVYRGVSNALDNSRAARIGALLVDLEIALRTGDRRASSFARDIASLLDGMDASQVPGAAATTFREIADSSGGAPLRAAELLHAATESMPGVNDERIRAGAWLEAARLAAAARDTAFFRVSDELKELTGATALPLDTRQRLHRTDSALRVSRPMWPTIEADLDTALRTLESGAR